MIEYDVTITVKVRVQKDSGEEAEKYAEQRIYDDLEVCFDDNDDIQLLDVDCTDWRLWTHSDDDELDWMEE